MRKTTQVDAEMKKLSYKEIERQRREEYIVKMAERLLLERGYQNLNMDELADLVGISKPTLYQHFSGKDAIAVRVLMVNYQRLDEFLCRPLDEPAIDRLTALIRRSLVIHGSGSILGSLRSDMNPPSVWKMVHENPYLASRKLEFARALHMLVDKAKAEGSIDVNIPTQVVTHVLLTLNRSLSDPTLQADLAGNPERLEGAIESVIRVFLHGVTPLPVNSHSQSPPDGESEKESSSHFE